MNIGPQGWIDDPAAVSSACERLALRGHPVTFAAGQPDLIGYWPTLVQRGITAVLAYTAEKAVLGDFQPANTQQRGTCVGQGTERALRDSILFDIHRGAEIAEPARIAFELIYAGARTTIRHGQLGAGDGAVVADAAEFMHTFGTIARGVYGSYDLTRPREDLAVKWGAPGASIPPELLAAAANHKVRAYHCADFERACDCLAAGYCPSIGCNRIHSEYRDANGMCRYASPGGHCTEFCGVFVMRSWNGDPQTLYDHTGLVNQQSWGEYPRDHPVLRYYGGDAPLRQGAFGLASNEVRAMFRSSGDAWAYKMEQHDR